MVNKREFLSSLEGVRLRKWTEFKENQEIAISYTSECGGKTDHSLHSLWRMLLKELGSSTGQSEHLHNLSASKPREPEG